MPRKGISYEQVANACNDLQKTQRLSVRAIQARTGGSMTTVLKHYRRWQRERSGEHGVEQDISERLRHALLSELEEAATRSRQAMQSQLQTSQRQLVTVQAKADQARQQLARQQKQAELLHRQYGQRQRVTEQRAVAAERELRSLRACLVNRQLALNRERRLRRASEAALQEMQILKQAAEARLSAQEQKLRALEEQAPDPQQQKPAPQKKQGKKVQQSLFDF